MAKTPRPLRALVVGGGIQGTSSALALRRAGLDVTVLEKAIPGAEASSAAAGILGADIECDAPGPFLELCRRSRKLYDRWARDLAKETGIDVGFTPTGTLEVEFDAAILKRHARRRAFQIRDGAARKLNAKELGALEPELDPRLAGAHYFPGDASLVPISLFRATHIAAERGGVVFRSGATVRRIVLDEGAESRPRARGVLLDDGSVLEADVVVIAAGSWTSLIEGLPLRSSAVIPARGQIVEVQSSRPLLDRVVFGAGVYLIPRRDGALLIGSTLEFVGFQKGVTAEGVRRLLTGAMELVPTLAQAEVTRSWSNFRPFTADHLPLLGTAGVDGLVIAAGHYRNGILLAPVTAELVTALALGRKPPLDLSPFDPRRDPPAA